MQCDDYVSIINMVDDEDSDSDLLFVQEYRKHYESIFSTEETDQVMA